MAKQRMRRNRVDQLSREFRRKGGGSRQTTLRVFGGKLDKDGTPFRKEHLQCEDEKEGPRIVDVVQTGTCAFGHAIDDKVRIAGVCEIGGEVLCATEGCMRQCVCGAVVCRRHSRTFAEKTHCRPHIWIHYWRMFWRLD